MHILLSALLAATPTPTPTVDPAETWYSPGTIGFIMTFFITVGAIGLIFDMVRRIRRVRYRAEIAEKLAAEANSSAQLDATPKPAAKPAAKAKPERPAPPAKPKR
jgi:nucleoid-associated protein YgaU